MNILPDGSVNLKSGALAPSANVRVEGTSAMVKRVCLLPGYYVSTEPLASFFQETLRTLVMHSEHRMSDVNRIFLDALERYERPLIRFAQNYTRELEDARDVVQDVFLRLSQNIDTIDQTRLAAWLFTTCKNRALDFHRKYHRIIAMDTEILDLEADPASSPGENMEARETTAMLHRMINELPAKQRQAVWLKFVIDLSYQEISQIMETSIGNVGYLIHHGVVGMRTKWKSLEPA